MSFHEVRFPFPLSFGARGGPQRQTEIVQLASGHEQRNSSQSRSRRQYDVGAGIKSLDDLHQLIEFFEARSGELYGFLFKDPMDNKSCPPQQGISALDQIIGHGDGEAVRFNVIKTYGDAAGEYIRSIDYPAAHSLVTAVNGAPQLTNYDEAARQIVFESAPDVGAKITAGYEFYVPVRFAADQLDVALEAFGAGHAVNIPLVEIYPYA